MIKILKDSDGKEIELGRNEIERSLLQIDKRIEHLKNLYALYFNGELKLPPEKDRETLEKEIIKLTRTESRSPRVNMMIHNISSKFSVFNNMWLKKMSELESGITRLPTGPKRISQAPSLPAGTKKPKKIKVNLDLNREDSFETLVVKFEELLPDKSISTAEKDQLINSLKTKMIMENLVTGKAELELKNGEIELKIME